MVDEGEAGSPGPRASADDSALPLQFERSTRAVISFDTPLEVAYIRETEVDRLLRARFIQAMGLVMGSVAMGIGLSEQLAYLSPVKPDPVTIGIFVQVVSVGGTRRRKKNLPTAPGGKRMVLRHKVDDTAQPPATDT